MGGGGRGRRSGAWSGARCLNMPRYSERSVYVGLDDGTLEHCVNVPASRFGRARACSVFVAVSGERGGGRARAGVPGAAAAMVEFPPPPGRGKGRWLECGRTVRVRLRSGGFACPSTVSSSPPHWSPPAVCWSPPAAAPPRTAAPPAGRTVREPPPRPPPRSRRTPPRWRHRARRARYRTPRDWRNSRCSRARPPGSGRTGEAPTAWTWSRGERCPRPNWRPPAPPCGSCSASGAPMPPSPRPSTPRSREARRSTSCRPIRGPAP